MFRRIKAWNRWRRYNVNSRLFQYLVLFGILRSSTFEIYRSYYDDDRWWFKP
jgi:hypothetical protein